MSTVSSISTSTLSSLITSSSETATESSDSTTASATTSTSTDTSSTDTSDTAAYSLEITPTLIKAALKNTYTTQIFEGYQDSTTTSLVLYDYYNNLSVSALNYVVSSNSNSSSTSSSSSVLDILA
ncbi:hypothetical protein [Sporomusa aerivorans]|uniref:hypothetical protein n=1 Tax=Sporomusa aerivorans TaxID=204936 RepID=UPI00352A095D